MSEEPTPIEPPVSDVDRAATLGAMRVAFATAGDRFAEAASTMTPSGSPAVTARVLYALGEALRDAGAAMGEYVRQLPTEGG